MTHLELVHAVEAHDGRPRADHYAIAQMVDEGSKVLVLGCGNGALLRVLAQERNALARGIERDARLVRICVRAGLPVVQGDAETDLDSIPSGAFDVVVIPDAIRSFTDPHRVLKEGARIADRLVVRIRNAAHWRARFRLLHSGRMGPWDNRAARSSSIRDFADLARSMRLNVERATPISGGNPGAPFAKALWRANWFAEEAVFLLGT